MVAVELLPLAEAEAKERQKLSQGQGVKGKPLVADLKVERGQSAEFVGKLLGVTQPASRAPTATRRELVSCFGRCRSGRRSQPRILQSMSVVASRLPSKPSSDYLHNGVQMQLPANPTKAKP